jgi:hypothetical protein
MGRGEGWDVVCRILSLVSSASIVPWFTALSCHVMCCAVLYCAVLCCIVLCCAVLCCAVLCCVVLCCTVVCSMLTVDVSYPQTFRFIALSSARQCYNDVRHLCTPSPPPSTSTVLFLSHTHSLCLSIFYHQNHSFSLINPPF